jgi:uncharacterized protein with PQ loop repeat
MFVYKAAARIVWCYDMTMKEVFGSMAAVLTLIGYGPYIWDTIKGKTYPHVYSWFLYTLIAFLVFGIQYKHNAGAGAYITLTAGILCLVLFILGLRIGEKHITRFDTGVLALTIIAVGVWLLAKQPILSVILATLVDLMAFVPTIRKTWKAPHTETLSLYTTNVIRYVVALIALSSFTFVNALYPIVWLLANGLFAIGLILRRRYVSRELP